MTHCDLCHREPLLLVYIVNAQAGHVMTVCLKCNRELTDEDLKESRGA